MNSALTIKVGDRLDPEQVAATIDRLFATGRYADIQVASDPGPDGVTVRIVTELQDFVGHIAIKGDVGRWPTASEMIEATRLRLGEPVQEEEIRRAEERLHRLLTSNGLYEHTLRTEFHVRPDFQQRDITFVVDTGARAKYNDPVIEGNTVLSESTILRATGWRWRFIHLWRKVTQERTNKGIVNVQRKYENDGYLTADVTLGDLRYDREAKRLFPTIVIDPGPKVEVRSAEAKVSKRVLKRYVPIYQELAVYEDLLVAGATNLRDYFQSQGYFDAEVDFREREAEQGQRLIEYVISLGTRYKLVKVELRGNQVFTTEELREHMFLQESGLLRLRHGRFSRTFLERDEEAIRNLYKANGFQGIQVTSEVQNNYQGKPDEVAVLITVDEGPLWLVRRLTLAGAEKVPPAQILPAISSVEGQPYSEVNVARDRDVIVGLYQAAGYANATFAWSVALDEGANEAELTFEIQEGTRQIVRDIRLTGIEMTKLDLVTRHLTLAPGDPLSLTEMSQIQQRLYNLGIFARIDMAIQNPAGSTEFKRVIYDFHEASRYSLAVGVGGEFARIGGTTSDLSRPEGAPGLSPRLSIDLSRLNFLGRGHSISLRGRISRLEQVASFNYLAPRFRDVQGRNVTFTMQYQVSRDVRTFSSRREEAAIQVSQQISKPSTILVRFAYRRVSANNIVIPRLLIPQLLQPIRLGLLYGNFVQDRRDNPADATRGVFNTLDLSLASNIFGSQRSFFRTLGRNASYHTLKKGVVLARATSVGLIFPFRVPEGVREADAIPLPERFYGGGSATHRGFPENQSGPRDTGDGTAQATGFPLGGNALFFNQVELRFPLLGQNIGGVVFHDAGNIYQRIGDLSFRVHQRGDTDFNYMVHAVGFGIRYKTPVGPVRGDLAYSVNPPRYQGLDGTTQELLNCGTADASCPTVARRVSHFQFFFSIGQTF